MDNVKELAVRMNVMPKLRLAIKLLTGDFISTGPHHVRFVHDAIIVQSTDKRGREHEDMVFFVEENGIEYQWIIAVRNHRGEPSYLIEKLLDVKVGDVRTLEMIKRFEKSFIDVRATLKEDMPAIDHSEEEIEKALSSVKVH